MTKRRVAFFSIALGAFVLACQLVAGIEDLVPAPDAGSPAGDAAPAPTVAESGCPRGRQFVRAAIAPKYPYRRDAVAARTEAVALGHDREVEADLAPLGARLELVGAAEEPVAARRIEPGVEACCA